MNPDLVVTEWIYDDWESKDSFDLANWQTTGGTKLLQKDLNVPTDKFLDANLPDGNWAVYIFASAPNGFTQQTCPFHFGMLSATIDWVADPGLSSADVAKYFQFVEDAVLYPIPARMSHVIKPEKHIVNESIAIDAKNARALLTDVLNDVGVEIILSMPVPSAARTS